MKRLKSFLHLWIAAASTISFLGGWIVFSHSAKPETATASLPAPAVQTTTTLAPVPSLDSLLSDTATTQSTTLQQLPSLQVSVQTSATNLVTRGS